MPDAYVLNQFPSSFGGAISVLAELLVSAGWSYRASGDGLACYAPPSVTATVTITVASPAVVTWTSHGLLANTPVVFTTTGSLPTGITAGVTYYVHPTSILTNSFRIAATPGGAAINTSVAGSGVHTGTSQAKIFTNTGTGNLGWDNSSAWARLQDPSGVRELLFQHDASGKVKIRYSRSTKFVSAYDGVASYTVPPTAVDEVYIAGQTGTSSNLDYYTGTVSGNPQGQWISTGVTKSQVICQGFASGTAPYGFWFAMQEFPRGALRGGIIMDPVKSVPEDPDPFVFHIGGVNVFSAVGGYTGTAGQGYIKDATQALTTWGAPPGVSVDGCWAFMDPGATQFLYVQPACYGLGIGNTLGNMLGQSARGLSSNPFSGKPEALPLVYMRASPWLHPTSSGTGAIISVPYSGVKGWSTMVRYTGAPRATFKDTIEGKSFIAVGDFWLPWDGATSPLG